MMNKKREHLIYEALQDIFLIKNNTDYISKGGHVNITTNILEFEIAHQGGHVNNYHHYLTYRAMESKFFTDVVAIYIDDGHLFCIMGEKDKTISFCIMGMHISAAFVKLLKIIEKIK